ncbi:sigma 54 modulation/S30EA ribosomal C-terminal domain-containing protein [Kitasatospora purpeofusca]|uniref:sigma 54 modulation/S30EA ribosomal C-terminal domain-containing protein n=1 Tax=Kitasatospora purpeofusca TaxID=67352 RepID=UPI00324BC5DD
MPVGSVTRLEVPCPPGPRRIVRRKRPQLVRCSPDAAARTMDAMDYDIHLFFAQPGSGRGRVLYRRFDGGLGLIAAAS